VFHFCGGNTENSIRVGHAPPLIMMNWSFSPFDIFAILAVLGMLGVVLFYRPKPRNH
jgi:hypothetical protein